MRGKKADIDFVSQFIIDCATNNKNSSQDILQEAHDKISEIDLKIKEIEQLKILRSKLLDVVNVFENKKSFINDNAKILNLFQIKNHHICKYICDIIKNNPIKLEDLKKSIYEKEDILFCIKQLIEYKVISKTGNIILRGARFDEYCKLVLQES